MEEALSEMFSTQCRIGDESLDVVRDFLIEVDPSQHWGGLQMVVAAEASIWTANEGVSELKEHCAKTTLKDSLRHYKELAEELEQYRCQQ